MESQTRKVEVLFDSYDVFKTGGEVVVELTPTGTRSRPRDVQDRYSNRFPLGDGLKQDERLVWRYL